MEVLWYFFYLGVQYNLDNSIERTAIKKVHPNTYNFNNSAQFIFSYDECEIYLISSKNTSFSWTFMFLTQGQNN